jgi:hypothetical protein
MWEMEGRTTEEIATALNTSPANVRHILVRARKSMVRVLEEWVVDESTGLTALNALSTTYKKAAQIAQKSSKAALSLLLVITAFLGFNSMTGNEGSVVSTIPSMTAVTGQAPAAVSESPSTVAATKAAVAAATKKAQIAALNAKIAALSFFGLSKDGLPTGFSVTDSKNTQGVGRVTKGTTTVGPDGIVVNNQFITGSVGPNVLIDQLITVDGTGTRYSVNGINIGWVENWNSVEIKSTDSSIDRLANGQFLITATFNLGYLNESDFVIPTGSRGYDLADAPKSITSRILMNAGKTQVLAQAVQVNN